MFQNRMTHSGYLRMFAVAYGQTMALQYLFVQAMVFL
jgi:hypothetical protein